MTEVKGDGMQNNPDIATREETCPMCLGTVRVAAKLTVGSWPRMEWFLMQRRLLVALLVSFAVVVVSVAYYYWQHGKRHDVIEHTLTNYMEQR